MKTAMETMNRANIILDFFEPVNRFKNQPAAKQNGQKQNDRIHIFLIYDTLPNLVPKGNALDVSY
jgi:hypothetical protein